MFARARSGFALWPELIAALIVGALLVTGCDTSVQPFVPEDEDIFSIFGVLDPAADTQFIRVDPIADSVQVGSPREIDATVTLTHLGTDRTVALRDSFMQVEVDVSVHNFWTTEPIEPGASYRLRAERSDGAASQATTTIPPAPPTIEHDSTFYLPCAGSEAQNTFEVTVEGVEEGHLAALWTIYLVNDQRFAFDHFDDAEYNVSRYEIPIHYGEDLPRIPIVGAPPDEPCIGRNRPSHALIAATAGGPDWPAFADASLNELSRPDTFSNVENGHGLLGGVYTDTVSISADDRPE